MEEKTKTPKEIRAEAKAKIAGIREKRKTDIEILKKEAKEEVKKETSVPKIVGNVKITEEMEGAFSLVIARRDSTEDDSFKFKKGDIIARNAVGSWLTQEIEQKISAVKDKALKDIEALRTARDNEIFALSAERIDEQIAKELEKQKKSQEKLAKLKALKNAE